MFSSCVLKNFAKLVRNNDFGAVGGKKKAEAPRLFHLRLRCILNEMGIFIVKTMGVWLVYFVDFQQNKCLKN